MVSGSSQRKAISCTQESFDISYICTQEKSHTSAAHAPPQDVLRTKTFTAHYVKTHLHLRHEALHVMSFCFPCLHMTAVPISPRTRQGGMTRKRLDVRRM